jgi:hypothetical protein
MSDEAKTNQKDQPADGEKHCYKCGKLIKGQSYVFKDNHYCCDKCCHSDKEKPEEGCEFC